jgi:hypothetical protein
MGHLGHDQGIRDGEAGGTSTSTMSESPRARVTSVIRSV